MLIEVIELEVRNHQERAHAEKELMWIYCLAPTTKVEITDEQDKEQQQGKIKAEIEEMFQLQEVKLEERLGELFTSSYPAKDVGRGAEIAEQGAIKSPIEELLRNQGTKLERLEEKLVSARPSSSEGKIKAEIEDMFRLHEVKLEKTLGELSSSSQLRQQQLENKIDAALISIQSATALILPKIASTPRTGGLNIDDVVPATSPVASDMLSVLPADVTRRLDSIQNDHTGGQIEIARASYKKLVDWCVLLDAAPSSRILLPLRKGDHTLCSHALNAGTAAGCPKPNTQARNQKRRNSGRSSRSAARLFRTRSRSRRDSCEAGLGLAAICCSFSAQLRLLCAEGPA